MQQAPSLHHPSGPAHYRATTCGRLRLGRHSQREQRTFDVPTGVPPSSLSLVSGRARIVAGRNSVGIANLPVRTMNDDLTATVVLRDRPCSINASTLRWSPRRRSIAPRLRNLPAAIRMRRHMTLVSLRHLVPPSGCYRSVANMCSRLADRSWAPCNEYAAGCGAMSNGAALCGTRAAPCRHVR